MAFLSAVKELYWSEEYIELDEVIKRYNKIDLCLEKYKIDPELIIINFVSAKQLTSVPLTKTGNYGEEVIDITVPMLCEFALRKNVRFQS